tara:strand:- start:417 stop:839 length:423 start_codon:yes stop_codon:yes gene_type:complete
MSRNKYVLYNNVTGNIESIETITEAKAIKLCTLNRGMNMSYILESDIDGSVHSSKLLQLELSTTPISVKLAPNKRDDNLPNKIKSMRNQLLTACDWTVGVDSPLSDSKKTEWQTYRQALRDFDYNSITEDYNIPWPTRPE